jgi:hypothetical protein
VTPRQIYALDKNRLVALSEQPYDSEERLQRWLAEHPVLLAGDQMDESNPRRWLLVAREVGVPDEPDASDRWAVDHLFLDQDGVPTLVEVKRSTDTRLRREVVGQMLDYAANAATHWSVESIRAGFESRCERSGSNPNDVLADFLSGADAEQFWGRVKTNLQAGKIRLVFAADEIPSELRRVVEFLNEQMDPAEVLALEIRQFAADGLATLVPTIIGNTARAKDGKRGPGPEGREWDEASVLAELRSRCGNDDAAVGSKLLEWARSRGLRIWFGRGKKDGTITPILDVKGTKQFFFAAWTYGSVEVQFEIMQRRPPFENIEARRELQRRLNLVPSVAIGDDALARRPSIPLATLRAESALRIFLDAFDWELEEIKRWAGPGTP